MYFRLTESAERNIIGRYPQLQITDRSYFDKPSSTLQYERDNRKPDEGLELPKVKLDRNAKMTDVLSGIFMVSGLVVNKKARVVLENFKLGNYYRFYSLEIKDSKIDYYVLYFVNDFLKYVDFSKSYFSIDTEPGQPKEIGQIQDINEYNKKNIEALNRGKWLGLHEIWFKNDFPKYDLLCARNATNQLFVSDSLKSSLEENNISGLEFNEVKFFI